MFPLPRHINTFLFISYGFSFVLWFGAWSFANRVGANILLNNEIYFWDGNPQVLIVSLLFSIATLGPFIGALFVRKQSNITLSTKGFNIALVVFGLLFGLHIVLMLGAWLFARDTFTTSNINLGAVLFALLYFALTSGTEEFGWRGVLYPHVKKHSKSLWDSAFVTGLIWGPWHTPFVLYLFVTAGMPIISIVLGYVGFIMTIVLQSYLHGFVNVRGGSTLANYLLHTLHNWFPILLIFIFQDTPIATVASIGGYVLTLFFLERFFSSEQFFEVEEKEVGAH
ncbi:MAG: CPBP family intramembrane glutamic endopeptidase [Chloroflexota bacterium]